MTLTKKFLEDSIVAFRAEQVKARETHLRMEGAINAYQVLIDRWMFEGEKVEGKDGIKTQHQETVRGQ